MKINKEQIEKTLTLIEERTRNLHSVWVLLVCCYIDALGRELYKSGNSSCRFKRFISDYMRNTYQELENKSSSDGKHKEYYLDLLYSNIRCGLVHEYFPKSKTKIIYSRGKDIVDRSEKNQEWSLIINARRFKEDFLTALNMI